MPREVYAMSTGGQAFEITLLPDFNQGDRQTRSFARYAEKNLLASGWISGEKAVLGKSIALESPDRCRPGGHVRLSPAIPRAIARHVQDATQRDLPWLGEDALTFFCN